MFSLLTRRKLSSFLLGKMMVRMINNLQRVARARREKVEAR